MCEPVSIGLAVASIGSIAAQYVAQKQQADQQKSYQDEAYQANAKIAKTDFINKTDSLNIRRDQEIQAAAQAAAEQTRQAIRSATSTNAAAVSLGTAGNTIEALTSQYGNIAAANDYVIRKNLGATLDQLDSEALGLRADTLIRINAARGGPVAGPSAVAAGMSMASAGFSSYDKYQ